MPGKTAKKMIGKNVFGTKIEHHIIHSGGGETIETINITEGLFQNLQSCPLIVERTSGKVMNHPCPLVGVDHGDVSVDPAVSLISQLSNEFRVIAIKLPIGFFHGLPVSLYQAIFFRINEPALKKKFP